MNKQELQEELMSLVFHIGRQMRRQTSGDHAGEYSPYQIQALLALKMGADTMGALAEEMNVTLPTATSLVDRLAKSGWVERRTDPSDRRVIRLHVTDEGRDFVHKMKKKRIAAFKTLLEVMPYEDQQALHRILTNVHKTLEKSQTKKGE